MIRLLIADDHTILRAGLRRIFDDVQDIDVAGEAGDGRAVLEFCRRDPVDVVLLDLGLPVINGFDCLLQLRAQHPEIAVLILSMHSEDHYALRVIRAGASGYLTKGAPPETLIRAVRTVASGGRHVSEELATRMALMLQGQLTGEPVDDLSPREFQIFERLARGQSQSQIAEELKISPKTVHTHKAHIDRKLGFTSLTELIAYARKIGLVDQFSDPN
ncbi:MAG: DNA-binding response regulator [Candidatus Dadabacteria bacterium]|nr:MAG: DNA-binding response regulator [Candidatus Dadabacteria bacterium]